MYKEEVHGSGIFNSIENSIFTEENDNFKEMQSLVEWKF